MGGREWEPQDYSGPQKNAEPHKSGSNVGVTFTVNAEQKLVLAFGGSIAEDS